MTFFGMERSAVGLLFAAGLTTLALAVSPWAGLVAGMGLAAALLVWWRDQMPRRPSFVLRYAMAAVIVVEGAGLLAAFAVDGGGTTYSGNVRTLAVLCLLASWAVSADVSHRPDALVFWAVPAFGVGALVAEGVMLAAGGSAVLAWHVAHVGAGLAALMLTLDRGPVVRTVVLWAWQGIMAMGAILLLAGVTG